MTKASAVVPAKAGTHTAGSLGEAQAFDVLRKTIKAGGYGSRIALARLACPGRHRNLPNSRSHSRDTNRARVLPNITLLKQRGCGECRVLAAPMARLQQKTQAAVPQVQPRQPGIPRAMVLTAAPCSPWCTGLVSHHHFAKRPAKLDTSVGVSGPHGLAVRAGVLRLCAPTRPSHPAPRFVTIAIRPPVRRGTAPRQSYIYEKRKKNIFPEWD